MDEPTSKWLRNLVNRHQTPQERRDKYFYLRYHGVHWGAAQRMRDWTWSHIELVVRDYQHFASVTPGAT